MSERITNADLQRALKRISRHVDQPSRLVLENGSPTNGRAWRLYASARAAGQGGLFDGFSLSDGYLGWTRREAYCALHGMACALETANAMIELGPTECLVPGCCVIAVTEAGYCTVHEAGQT